MRKHIKGIDHVVIIARYQPCMAALFIRVANRDTAEKILRSGGLHPTRMPDGCRSPSARRRRTA